MQGTGRQNRPDSEEAVRLVGRVDNYVVLPGFQTRAVSSRPLHANRTCILGDFLVAILSPFTVVMDEMG